MCVLCIISVYIILCYIILYHIMLYYIISYYVISYYIILCYIILYYIILYYIILYYITLHYITLYYIILYIILYYILYILYLNIHRVIMCWFWPIWVPSGLPMTHSYWFQHVPKLGSCYRYPRHPPDLGQHVGEGRGQGLTHLALLGPGAVGSKNLVMKKSGTWLGNLIPIFFGALVGS